MATHSEDAESTRGGQYHEENLWHRIYSMVLDTGATQMLVWDEQDSFLEDKRPAIARSQDCGHAIQIGRDDARAGVYV